jgi:hypothetical protein
MRADAVIARSVSRWRRAALAAWCLGAVLVPAGARAQGIFGAVRGRVTDSLGAAAGARVVLVGTAFSALADSSGAFAMDRVPAGTYVVRAEAVTGARGEAADARVPSGGTVIVDVRLGERREAPTAAEREGELASRTMLSGRRLAALPIDDARQALALAPGVVMRGTDLGIAGVPDLTIRGSGAGQTAVFVDGAPARFETMGMSQLALGSDAISEVSVTTGAAPASVADAREGAIAYVTRAGGPRFEAGVSAGTDGPFSRASTVGFNRFDGFAGGPVPGVRHLTWFVSGALYGQSSRYRGAGADTVPAFGLAGTDTVVTYAAGGTTYTAAVPRFAQVSGTCGALGGDAGAAAQAIRDNYGLACQGLRLNLDWSTSRRAQAKLSYSYGDGSSVSLTALASDFEHRDYPGQDMADNALYTGERAASRLAVVNWSHRLARPLGGTLRLEGNLSVGSDTYQSGPLDLSSELSTRAPALGIELSRLRFAGLGGLPLPLTDAVIRQMRTNAFRPPLYGRNDLAPYQEFRLNPYGVMGGWPTGGFAGEALVATETRVNGRLDGRWRATPALTVTAGVDFSRTDLSYYDGRIVTGVGWNGFLAHPRRTGLFGQARLYAAPFTIEAGVRADRYVTGADFPKAPGRIFTNPAWITGDTSYDARISRIFDPGRAQTLVTPTVRVGFAVGPRTAARLAFDQRVVVPPFDTLFANVNSDLALNSSAVPFGRDVGYVKSTLVEAGVRHAFTSGVALDGAAYLKTNVVPYWIEGTAVYDPFLGGSPDQPNETLTLLQRASGSRAIGVDLRVEWGAGRPVGGSAAYSIEQTRYGFLVLTGPPGSGLTTKPPSVTTQAIAGALALRVPDDWARGSAVGSVLRGVSAEFVGRLTSGAPYTAGAGGLSGEIAPNGDLSPGPTAYSKHLPWTRSLDLRVAKSATVGRLRWTAYAEARNLLDVHNVVALFAETGKDVNPAYRGSLVQAQAFQIQQDAGGLWTTRPVTINGVTQNLEGVELSDCSLYPQGVGGSKGVVDCLALRQVEARWGNGDRFYDANEIDRALNAWYDAFYGTWRFHGPARTARVGISLEF